MGWFMVVREYRRPEGEYHFFKVGDVVRKVGPSLYEGRLLLPVTRLSS